jgi:hypothetical protein
MKEGALLHITILHRKLLKKINLIYIQVWKNVATKIRQIQVVVYFEHYFAGEPARL